MSNLTKISIWAVLVGVSQVAVAKVDLGDDIMKPMGELAKQVAGDNHTVGEIADASKNTTTVQKIQKIEALLGQALDKDAKGLKLLPEDQDHYKAEVALVGKVNADTKYEALLVAARVSWLELEMLVTKADKAACGTPCVDKLKQIGALQSVAHGTYKDPKP